MLAWRRELIHNDDGVSRTLSPLKENGVNRRVKRRDIGSDYTMDETPVYNNEFRSDTRLVMQGAKVPGDFVTSLFLQHRAVYGGKSSYSTTRVFSHL